jgi:hypothetical protein
LLTQPVAVVAVGVVVIGLVAGTVDPHPRAIPEDPMTVEVVVIAAAIGVATVVAAIAIGIPAAVAAKVAAGTGSGAIEVAGGV